MFLWWQGVDNSLGEGDKKYGIRILKEALQAPARTIVANAGKPPTVIIDQILNAQDDRGYNAANATFEPLIAAGVIYPIKVSRLALENAVSVAGMMLTTYCLIAEEKDEQQPIEQ